MIIVNNILDLSKERILKLTREETKELIKEFGINEYKKVLLKILNLENIENLKITNIRLRTKNIISLCIEEGKKIHKRCLNNKKQNCDCISCSKKILLQHPNLIENYSIKFNGIYYTFFIFSVPENFIQLSEMIYSRYMVL